MTVFQVITRTPALKLVFSVPTAASLATTAAPVHPATPLTIAFLIPPLSAAIVPLPTTTTLRFPLSVLPAIIPVLAVVRPLHPALTV